jgi:hypothetical protein
MPECAVRYRASLMNELIETVSRRNAITVLVDIRAMVGTGFVFTRRRRLMSRPPSRQRPLVWHLAVKRGTWLKIAFSVTRFLP